jgi:acetyl-CoA acetyltransferase
MNQAYIINGVRTAIGNFGGTLSSVRADDLATLVLQELMKKNPSVNWSEVGDVIMGCANQAGEDNRNVARMAGLMAGLPITVPGQTVNRL